MPSKEGINSPKRRISLHFFRAKAVFYDYFTEIFTFLALTWELRRMECCFYI